MVALRTQPPSVAGKGGISVPPPAKEIRRGALVRIRGPVISRVLLLSAGGGGGSWPQIPCPREWRRRSTVSPGTTPAATASANGTRRSCQLLRRARQAQRQASPRRRRHA